MPKDKLPKDEDFQHVETGDILTFDLECIPDWQIAANLKMERLEKPVPAELSQLTPVELMTSKKVDDVKKYIDENFVPEEWIGSLIAIEKEAKKPRVTLLEYLESLKSKPSGPAKRYNDQNKSLSVHPRRCRPIALGYAFDDNEPKSVIVTKDFSESDLLSLFWRLVSRTTSQLCGYNIKSYDVPVMMHRSAKFGVHSSLLNGRRLDPKRRGNVPILDLMEIYCAYGDFTSLKTLAAELGIEVPAGDFEGSQVQDAYLAGRFEELGNYVRSDVELCQKLTQHQQGFLI